MKHARHFLLMVATLLCSFAVHAEGIADVTELSNTSLYVVTQPNFVSNNVVSPTSWTVAEEGAMLTRSVTINQEDQRQQFAFISNDGGETYYLYHPATQKFVNKDASLGDLPMEAVYFTAGITAGTFVVYFDATHVINTNDAEGLVISRWGPLSGYGEADAGNSCAIIPVGEFDPTEALATFAAADEEKKKNIEFNSGANGWIEGADWYDESQRIVGFTSPLYQFSDKVETLRITVSRDQKGDKFFCLSELAFYDADGQKIKLTEDCIVSNADHNALNPNEQDGGGILALLDGETSTFFHSAWKNMPSEDHYLEITLPDGGYDAFSFSMLSRAANSDGGHSHTFPAEMVMTTSVPLASQAPIEPDTPGDGEENEEDPLGWAGLYRVNAAKIEEYGGYNVDAWESWDMTIVYNGETQEYSIIDFFAYYSFDEGEVLLTPSAKNPNEATFPTGFKVQWAMDGITYYCLRSNEFTNSPLTITRLEDGTLKISDFKISYVTPMTDGTEVHSPALWYQGITAEEYEKEEDPLPMLIENVSTETNSDGAVVKIHVTFNKRIGTVSMPSDYGFAIFKEGSHETNTTLETLFSEDGKTVTFELREPLFAPGEYWLDISQEISSSSDYTWCKENAYFTIPYFSLVDLSFADPTKCYTVTTNGRGAWTIDAEGKKLSSTALVDANDSRQQFAVLSVNQQDYYLYSVGANKFVQKDGALVNVVGDAIAFTDVDYIGIGRVQVHFRDFSNSYVNIDGEGNLVINGYSTKDDGNAVMIVEAADFDATHALSILSNPEQAELVTLVTQVRELLTVNENNHAVEPTFGQYPTEAYEALTVAVETENITLTALQEAVATFEAAKCFPVFTIDGAYEYVEGMSIYQIEQQLRWKQTDLTDKSMLWAIDIAETTVEVADQLVAKNLLTGDTFYGAPFIKVAETSEEIADDGLFLLYLAGRGYPVYAHESGIIITQNELSASSASAWKFTYVGTSYELSALPDKPEMPAGVINTLSAADPTKCYTIATKGRGAWAVDAENTRFSYVAVGDIDATADEQQFAILTVNDEDYYLYSVGANKFVKHDGSLDRFAGDALEFADASTIGTGRVQVRFRDYERSYINLNPKEGLIINYWGTIDEGNAVLIAEAGEFNAEEALSILADPEAAMLEALLAEAQEIVAANAENHTEEPVLGKYSTAGYEAFVAALEMEDITLASLREAFAAFEASKCLPVFTIDGVYKYAAGMSIFEATDGGMLWRATNESDKTMLWSFDMTETTVGVTDRVVVRNLSTGNLFWNASFMQVTETYEVTEEGTIEGAPDDGLFLLYTEGSGAPVHADEATQSIVHWNNLSANSASAWKFTYVGTTYELSALPDRPEVPEGVVNTLADADPTKCYTISTNVRGAWAVDAEGTYFSTTTVEGYEVDATDARQQFAILSANDEDYYLYSVSAQKFVKRDRTLTTGRADAIEFVDGSDIGAGRVLVRFRDIDDANINIGGDKQMIIDRWNTIDGGNAVLIAEATEFNAEDALAMLANPDAAELANLVRQAENLLAANAENHALEPTLGKYSTEAYEALVAAMNAEEVTLSSLQEAVAAFEASKCLPVFAIDGIAFGMSLYESELDGLRWQAFDRDDHTMLWVFDMTETSVGVTDRVVVRNLGTGNRFKDAFFIKVAETEEADTEDGRFLIHPEGVGFPLCAQANGLVNPVKNWSADSPSAWKFTYMGTTYAINEQPTDPDTPGDGGEVEPTDVYYMAPLFVEGRASSVVKIPIKMENSGPVVGFQFDMFLPEGVSVVTTTEDGETLYNIALNKDRAKSSHTVDAEPQENGALKIVSLSLENVPFDGNDGVILEVEVAIDDLEEGYYDVILRNIRMTHDNGVEEKCLDYASRIYVKGVLMGDVDGDGTHTISDVVMTINAVLGRPQAKFDASAADMNGDGMITVGDAVSVLRLVLGGETAQAPARSAVRGYVAAPALEAGSPFVISDDCMVLPVELNNSEAYSAFQLDVVLPEGVALAEATLTGRAKGNHHVAWNTLPDGTVRVVAYAMNNAAFEGNDGTLFNLVLNTSEAQTSIDEVLIADALFATAQGVERRANDVNVPMYAETTGVDEVYTMPIRVCGTEGAVVVTCATQSAISIYAITGQLVQYTIVEAGKHIIALSAGVYVVNGSKVIVK